MDHCNVQHPFQVLHDFLIVQPSCIGWLLVRFNQHNWLEMWRQKKHERPELLNILCMQLASTITMSYLWANDTYFHSYKKGISQPIVACTRRGLFLCLTSLKLRTYTDAVQSSQSRRTASPLQYSELPHPALPRKAAWYKLGSLKRQ